MTTKSSKKEISNYEYDIFVCTKETLRQTLDTYGVAIIPNVLDDIECDIMIETFWGFFEHITQQWKMPLNRHDKKTWREFYNLFPVHSMLVQHFGFGHALWNIRQNPKIVMIFAYLWECKMEELLHQLTAEVCI